jgi:cyclopropane fatty-acyl-phospholipid synthase-like methyltransferase
MSLRFYEIAESRHSIQNPFHESQLPLLAEIAGIREGMRQLDLACGHGELLCRWARDYGVSGLGVDISPVFAAAARERAAELGVADQVSIAVGDAATYDPGAERFDVVSCIGASWIGGGTAGTLRIMRRWLKPGGVLLIGEIAWKEEPPAEICAAMGIAPGDWPVGLYRLFDVFTQEGCALVDFIMAEKANWDRYMGLSWRTTLDWLAAHPGDPIAADLRAWHLARQREYFYAERPWCEWGVFVLREA